MSLGTRCLRCRRCSQHVPLTVIRLYPSTGLHPEGKRGPRGYAVTGCGRRALGPGRAGCERTRGGRDGERARPTVRTFRKLGREEPSTSPQLLGHPLLSGVEFLAAVRSAPASYDIKASGPSGHLSRQGADSNVDRNISGGRACSSGRTDVRAQGEGESPRATLPAVSWTRPVVAALDGLDSCGVDERTGGRTMAAPSRCSVGGAACSLASRVRCRSCALVRPRIGPPLLLPSSCRTFTSRAASGPMPSSTGHRPSSSWLVPSMLALGVIAGAVGAWRWCGLDLEPRRVGRSAGGPPRYGTVKMMQQVRMR